MCRRDNRFCSVRRDDADRFFLAGVDRRRDLPGAFECFDILANVHVLHGPKGTIGHDDGRPFAYTMVCRSVVIPYMAVVRHVPEVDPCAARKVPRMGVAPVVGIGRGPPRVRHVEDRAGPGEVGVLTAEDDGAVLRIHHPFGGVHEQGGGLARAGRAAEQAFPHGEAQEHGLLRRGRPRDEAVLGDVFADMALLVVDEVIDAIQFFLDGFQEGGRVVAFGDDGGHGSTIVPDTSTTPEPPP